MNELLTTSEAGQADRLAAEGGVATISLMERAGQAVAEAALGMVWGPDRRVAVLCGPGNNGGDGFVAARHLRDKGWDVRLFLLGDRDALKGDAAEMARRWPLVVRPATPDALQSMHLVIDALFGAGLSRPLEGEAAELVRAVNASGLPVLSVDVPSGLDGTSGEVRGAAVQARRTVTFFRKKPGHVLMPGRQLCGEVIVADIGIPERVLETLKPKLHENGLPLWVDHFNWPKDGGHKYDRGHAVVVSGPALQTGAARLGARAALRVGAGLVTLVGNAAATAIIATQITSIMVRSVSGATALSEFLRDTRRNAVLIGPGASVGPETADDVLAVLRSSASVVLDADALTSFSDTGEKPRSEASMGFLARNGDNPHGRETLFAAIKKRPAPVAMTPHEGEFKRLFGELPGSKIDRAREAAKLSGAIVVLKGADTVIAAPDGRAAVNSNAPPWLATAGSGDVLGGLVTGLLAQHMPPFEAACAAVWLHGEAANAFGMGLIAEDLPDVLPKVLQRLFTERV
ncbi:bifunctional ADP-dependent NAD(P)H-hydrate dehydratase/NAD(P)H-hydrate epimerase [Hyphomicrobium sp. 802]|uniref:bifunctional ADP-dependent NAD(P)H-hydrate dehydratase/NAD(P)H-hydrate epimerase n=1 Tax=Hyphomicrobium sp. 802 TaxID=1112272 RepID=UPI00045EADBA|nr:bifunctional ADP-dependent NAD(P)H-hydrate dehydratase/NAD(P)H-hydrate epimerase [Hyphomicrobium sp. 802]